MKFLLRIALPLLAIAAAPSPPQRPASIPLPADRPFPGTMTLDVDATDTARGIFRVRQTIPVEKSGPLTLLFPAWLPGNHAPRGQIEKLAGLTIKAGGRTLAWKRDPYDVYAFHIDVPSGARSIEAQFQFLSATETDQGRVVVTDAMINLQWQSVSLYPAGWATRNIPVSASVTWPTGWRAGTALRPVAGSAVPSIARYQTVDYETLVDSPVFAGKFFSAIPLGSEVTLNVVADHPRYLAPRQDQIDKHKALVAQAIKLFGTRQFDHYDFLLALTDEMGSIGLEHHRSSENGVNPEYFTEWEAGPGRRNLLPHELTHSWVGKHRRPAGQAVSDFNTPLEDSLLWVYEGQTQFWGYVLGARSGLFTKQETLDALASIAATLDIRRARDWRALVDTTYDPIITPRRPKGWISWQRSEDYYNEGLLIWLEADAIIRQKTGGRAGLDDFARRFFGTKEGDWSAKPFTFDEVASTLNTVTPHDWAAFLNARINEKTAGAPLNGLTLGGYRLTYGDEPTGFFRDAERRAKELNLSYSLGLSVTTTGHVNGVVWDGPAFNAGLAVGMDVIAVNGAVWSEEVVKEAIRAAKGGNQPIRLLVRNGKRINDVSIMWNGGLRYPRLEKAGTGDGSLDLLLRARP